MKNTLTTKKKKLANFKIVRLSSLKNRKKKKNEQYQGPETQNIPTNVKGVPEGEDKKSI